MVAPARTLSWTLLSGGMAPLVQVPAGTMTRPPPAWFAALMAAAKAAVLLAPPLLAPNAAMLNVRFGLLTSLVAATIACASGQGRSLGANLKPAPAARGAAGPAPPRGGTGPGLGRGWSGARWVERGGRPLRGWPHIGAPSAAPCRAGSGPSAPAAPGACPCRAPGGGPGSRTPAPRSPRARA